MQFGPMEDGGAKKVGRLERAIGIFEEGMPKDTIPLTLVAINLATHLPVAMASLWIKDGTEWPEKTPWMMDDLKPYCLGSLHVMCSGDWVCFLVMLTEQ